MLRLQPHDLKVNYKPVREIPVGDTLSRANLPDTEADLDPVAINMVNFISITPSRYKGCQEATAHEMNELYQVILKGWPDQKEQVPHSIRDFWSVRDELSVSDGIVYKGLRIVVPPSLRPDMLKQIYESHLGISKCKQRAREALFWPGMSQQVENIVSDCHICSMLQNRQPAETLHPTPTPERPWQEVASDIFDWRGEHYLLTVDYMSKFIEVDKLQGMSSATTIETLMRQLAVHGLPEVFRTDNEPQYSSQDHSIQVIFVKIRTSPISRHHRTFHNPMERRREQLKSYGQRTRINTWHYWTIGQPH